MPKDSSERIPSTRQEGIVVKFDPERGFGFIRPDEAHGSTDRDVFVHVRNVAGRRSLRPGQRVTYYLTRTEKGMAAISVQGGSPLRALLGGPYVRFFVIGIGSALILLFGLATALRKPSSLALWGVLWVAAMSLTTFAIYGYDKAEAKSESGRTRVPEVVLHLLGLLGGTPGAYVAIRLFHHKTSKPVFLTTFWLIVAAQVGILLFLVLNRQLSL